MSFEIKIKWAGQVHSYDLPDGATLAELKAIIQQKTNIRHDRQKIMGLKCGEGDVVKGNYKVIVFGYEKYFFEIFNPYKNFG